MKCTFIAFFVLLTFTYSNLAATNRSDSLKNTLKVDSLMFEQRVTILSELSRIYQSIDSDSSFYFIDEAIKISFSNNNKDLYFKCILWKASIFTRVGKMQDSDSLLSYLENTGTAKLELLSSLYQERSNYYEILNKSLQAKLYGMKALDSFRLLGDTISQRYGIQLRNLALVFNDLDSYDSSLFYQKQAEEVFRKIKNNRLLASVYGNMGITHFYLDNIDSALIYFQKDEMLRDSLEDRRSQASALMNIGTLFSNIGLYEEANTNYFKALDVFQALKSTRQQALCQTNIASVYSNIGFHKFSVNYHLKALNLADSISDKFLIGYISSQLAKEYLKLNILDSAIHNANKSIETLSNMGSKQYYADASLTLANIHLAENNLNEANKHTLISQKTYTEIQNTKGIINSFISLCKINLLRQGTVSERTFKEHINTTYDLNFKPLRKELYRVLIDYYRSQELNKLALNYQDSLEQLESEILKQEELALLENKRILNNFKVALADKEKAEISNTELNESLSRSVTILVTIIILLLIVSVIGAYYFIKNKRNTKIASELSTKLDDNKVIAFGKDTVISTSELIYLFKKGNHTSLILTDDRERLIKITLKEALSFLPDLWFVQIHRSHAINLKFYDSTYNQTVILKNGDELSLGRTFKTNLKEAIKSI